MSRRCRGGSLGVFPGQGIPSPEAPTITIDALGAGQYQINIEVCPSFPDPGGSWQLQQWQDPDWVEWDDFVFDGSETFPFAAFTESGIDPGTLFRVLQLGGGTDFFGPSPPSNVVETT